MENVTVAGLDNANNLIELVEEVRGFSDGKPDVSFAGKVPITIEGTDYIGQFKKYLDFLHFQVLSPLPVNGNGSIFDVETSWGVDANSQNVYVVTVYDNQGNPTVSYFDEPGGNQLFNVVAPVRPLESAPGVTFREIGTFVLPIDSAAAKTLADVEESDNLGEVVGIPAGAVGAICSFMSDDEDCAAYFTSSLPSPLANGSVGTVLNFGDIYSPGRNPNVTSGDLATLTSSRFICETGKSGRLEVSFYEIA